MPILRPDDIDFAHYMGATDAKVKVRPASAFYADVKALLSEHTRPRHTAEMISTKLRGLVDFRPGEVTGWAGYSGHRKSMFVGQLALDLVAQRHQVLTASFEMLPERTLARMARQATASSTPSDGALDGFMRWTDGRLWVFDHLGRIGADKCLAVCRYFVEELGGTQIILDSMMMICNSEEHLDEQKQFTTALVNFAQEEKVHVHLVAHCRKPQSGEGTPPTKHDLRGSASITDQCANVGTIWSNKVKLAEMEKQAPDQAILNQPDAMVSIEKQRNGRFEGRIHLWFDDASLRFCDSPHVPVEPYYMGGV